ncbi:Mitochondrial import receptor subunit TOM20 B [Bulinus truncatus]|nr:Mitochondrial import receptor subunit TOM20 B [Bulinus truncatus]
MLSKTTIGIAAASAGICFIGYCVYFDRKRRNDPEFKKKLRERRKVAKEEKAKTGVTRLPDLTNPEAMQRFFLQEVQIGEEKLASGDIEEGVEHLSNAVAVCGQPQHLLQVLQQTLPPQVFALLVQKLPSVGARLAMAGAGGAAGQGLSESTGMVIDEVVD